MQLRKSIVYTLVLLCLVPGSLGNFQHLIKDALLKLELSHGILRECGSNQEIVRVAQELKAPLKNILKQASQAQRNELMPDPEYVKELTKAVCSTGNYKTALLSLAQGESQGSFEYRKVEPISQDTTDIIDVEVAESDSGDGAQSYPFSFSPLLFFALGAILGSVLVHYFLLLKRTPDSVGSKSLRRPEL